MNRATEQTDAADAERGAAPARQRPILRAESLGVWYGRQPAVKDVTLPIPADRITTIVGPSGCGKSSFLAALNRLTDLIEGASVTGRVLLNGTDTRGPNVHPVALRRRVGMIFQKPNPFGSSIRKNLEMPLREHGVKDRSELEARVESALRQAGLWDEVRDRLSSPAPRLSGGQQQRLCIARALALDPDVLLMDEPCSALDPIASAAVEDLIRSLPGRTAPVIVTHNLAQARRIADRLAVFWLRDGAGTLIEHGEAARLFDEPREPITRQYLSGERG